MRSLPITVLVKFLIGKFIAQHVMIWALSSTETGEKFSTCKDAVLQQRMKDQELYLKEILSICTTPCRMGEPMTRTPVSSECWILPLCYASSLR